MTDRDVEDASVIWTVHTVNLKDGVSLIPDTLNKEFEVVDVLSDTNKRHKVANECQRFGGRSASRMLIQGKSVVCCSTWVVV